MWLCPLRKIFMTLRACRVKDPFVCCFLHLAVLLPVGVSSGWVVGSSGPFWPWLLVKVRGSSLAAVPGRRMTASSLTLRPLFSSSLLPSTHPNLNRHTADGIGLPQSVFPGSCRNVWDSWSSWKIVLNFTPFTLSESLSWHLHITCFVWVRVLCPFIYSVYNDMRQRKAANNHTWDAVANAVCLAFLLEKWLISFIYLCIFLSVYSRFSSAKKTNKRQDLSALKSPNAS